MLRRFDFPVRDLFLLDIPVVALLAALSLLSACATSSRDRAWLNTALEDRVGAGTRGGESEEALPADVVLEDGLDERETTALALWRSPFLRAELTRIDAARATLDEASRPANPQLTLAGPLGPITAVATLLAPLESLWQLPDRTAAAARDADVAGETALMAALTLVRDARLLHVELGLAEDRARVRAELAEVSAELARVGAVRARVGETSSLEADVFAADARSAADAADLAGSELSMARARLGAQLALEPELSGALTALFASDSPALPADPRELIGLARSLRPDVRAAELGLEAAASRAGWERGRVLALAAVVDAQWSEAAGPAVRLGGRIDLPIFGANPGGIGRAEAEIERAGALVELISRTAVMEVSVAHARALQAERSRRLFETEVLPSLAQALRIGTAAYTSGEETPLVVLDVLRRSADARLRHAELLAESRRARAELERAIGARLENRQAVADALARGAQ